MLVLLVLGRHPDVDGGEEREHQGLHEHDDDTEELHRHRGEERKSPKKIRKIRWSTDMLSMRRTERVIGRTQREMSSIGKMRIAR